jgi:hypothetical protein
LLEFNIYKRSTRSGLRWQSGVRFLGISYHFNLDELNVTHVRQVLSQDELRQSLLISGGGSGSALFLEAGSGSA